MSYRVAWRRRVVEAVRSWSLPDTVFVEVHLRLNALAQNPADQLVRLGGSIDGMALSFHLIDPQNRICEHFFRFKILYSQDEETLYIVRAHYVRRFA